MCAVIGAVAAFAITAPAGSAAPWTGSGTASATGDGRTPTTTVLSDGTSAPAKFHYDFVENQVPDGPGCCATGSFEFKTTASATGPVTLDWHYEGFHSFFQVQVGLTAFVHRGGSDVELQTLVGAGPAICCTEPSAGFNYSGRVVLNGVQAGDTYGFRMTGSNSDSNATLEGTLALAWVVDKTDDSSGGACDSNVPNDCSLRSAIEKANSTVGLDAINFNIPFAVGVQTITPATALPAISGPVTIDGYTQPGASANTLATGNNADLRIELNGNDGLFDGLVATAGGSTVSGLAINNFRGDAIELRTGGANVVEGNFIGTNAAGTGLPANGGGIFIQNSPGNRIGGDTPAARNVINATQNYAIYTPGACVGCPVDTGGGNVIQGNYVGTDKSGTTTIAAPTSVRGGIRLENANNTIGGTSVGARNVIATNGVGGIILQEAGAHHNTIQGNYIGVDATGGAAIAPGWGLTGITVLRAEDNTIGGSDTAARNVIATSPGISIFGVGGVAADNLVQNNYIGTNAAGSAVLPAGGNAGSAVQLDAASGNAVADNLLSGSFAGVSITPGSGSNLIRGNLIGTNAAGTGALPNNRGVSITSSNQNTIGGTTAADRNVISGNTTDGVFISGSNAIVQGNYIGVGSNGTTLIGNQDNGVEISGSNNVIGGIGGVDPGVANVIAGNGSFFNADGVTVLSGTGNAIRGNAIHSNANLGIDLGGNSVTPNDAGDGDTGANNLQNFPVLTSVSNGTINGTLRSSPNTTYALDFFSNAACDASGNGEAARYLGSTEVTTDGAGDAFFTASPPLVAIGEFVTATATDPTGNTSELSACVQATGNQTFTVNSNGDTNDGSCNASHCSLREAIVAANATSDRDTIAFNLPSGSLTIQPTSLYPSIGNPLVIDGTTQPGYAGSPLVEIDGQLAGANNNLFDFTGSSNVVKGLVMNRFSNRAIRFTAGGGSRVEGNYFGTNVAGDAAVGGFGFNAIETQNSPLNTIGGDTASERNVIVGGLVLSFAGSQGNVVAGNYIGTNATGGAELGTGGNVWIQGGTNNRIGGPGAERNVIAGSFNNGLSISTGGGGGGTGTGNLIENNFIGTDVSGTANLGYSGNSINVSTSGNTIRGNLVRFSGADAVFVSGPNTTIVGNTVRSNTATSTAGIRVSSANNTIGGTTAAARNVISGNFYGIHIQTATASGNVVSGNYIGTDAAGASAEGNAASGIRVDGAPTAVVGGPASGAGNVISGNQAGVDISGSGATGARIEGNLIGTTADGSAALGNGIGVRVLSGAPNADIGGPTVAERNVVSASTNGGGVFIQGPGATVQGNYIGTNAAGTAALGNSGPGVNVTSGGSALIGGTAAGAGNVISANNAPGQPASSDGIQLSSANNTVQGNRIGTDAAGGLDLGNGTRGILVSSDGNQIGGSSAAARNVISGNGTSGVHIGSGTENSVSGNYIGTNANGTAAIPNGGFGLQINSNGNTVGGATAADGNLISGNGGGRGNGGVVINGGSNEVEHNLIGTAANGTDDVGNVGSGVLIMANMGTPTSGVANRIARNVIAFNGSSAPLTSAGVDISAGSRNTVTENSIFSNDNLGIDLGWNGVTPNDTGDTDSGANSLQNFPELSAATASGDQTEIQGVMRGGPSLLSMKIEFFDSPACDASVNGEGKTFLGSITIQDQSGQDFPFEFVHPSELPLGHAITATATDQSGETSEFSGCETVTAPVVDPPQSGSTFTVNTAADTTPNGCTENDCTLREAINAANSAVGANSIHFDIGAGGAATIHPTSVLPTLTGPALLDGSTQGGFDGEPIIELDGSLAGSPSVQGLTLGDDVTVRGLVINDFSGHGIVIGSGSSGNKVEGSYIGTDLSGGVDRGNGLYGIVVSGASDTTIGGTTSAARNVISGNPNGITVGGNSSGTTIAGNYVGTNAAGTGAVGNAYGIQVDTSANTAVGGTDVGARNVISGNVNGGIITTGTNTGTKIQGNYVGTNAAGAGALANGLGGGVALSNGSAILVAGNVISGNSAHGLVLSAPAAGATIQGNFVGTKADGTGDLGNAREGIRIEGGSGTTVGGTTPAARNVVSGNNGHGILVYGASATLVQGNYAGTDVTGTIAIPNGIDGIGVDGGSNNKIGGAVAGAGNLASGNTNQGIAVFAVDFPSTTGNTVQGNKVGTKIDGTSALGNGGDGIRMHNAANTMVGGEAEGGQNRVAHNAGDGVVVFGTGSGNEIRRNSISSNGDLGIDLGANGITANDGGDTDTGPNAFQNFPQLTSVTKETGGVRIRGTLSSAANTGYSLDYYANASCDGSGNGEGDRWLGWSHISTNADGHLTFDTGNGLTASVNVGDAVTATATAPDGSTSEFSACRAVAEATTPASATITLAADEESVIAGAQSVPTGGIDLAALHAPRGGTTESTPLDAIPLDAIPLDAIPLDAIPLDAIGFTSTMLQDALGGVHLDEIPISTPPGGWPALLAGTPLEGVPLNTITLADVYAHNESAPPGSPNAVPLDAIPLDAIDLSATPLDAIGLGAIALGATPLDAIPLDAINGDNLANDNLGDWCAAIDALPGYECSSPSELVDATLIGTAVRGIPLDAIPLDAIPLDAIPLDAIPLDAIPLDAIPLDAIPLDAIPLDAIPLDAIPLDAINFAVSPLDAIPLDAIPLDAIGDFVDCSNPAEFDCTGKTLGEADAAGKIRPDATLFDLIGALIPDAHEASIADLIYGLPTPPRLTLGDLFALVLGGEGAYDWGDLDLNTFPLALHSPDGGVITYRATVQVTGGPASNDATIRATLPAGGFYKSGSTQLREAGESLVPLAEPTVGDDMLTWSADVDRDVQYELTWQVHAPLELGNHPITANVIVDGMESPDQTGPVSVAVIQTLEPNDNLGAGRSLEGDTLYLGYMLQGDVDRHVIDIPTAFGSVVKIKLTHIAEGTDLDLTVAGPPAPTLRAAPLDAIPLQNAQLPDTKVDLDQRSQPLPPENLQDVPTNVIASAPNVIRGVSDNRGNADEEVTLISQGETGEYIVQVSDYEGDSPMPYMLEVDVQGPPALGACSPRSFANAGQGVAGAIPSVPANTNTLILVNRKRLGDTYGTTAMNNVMTKLNQLAGRADLGIIGAVVPVEGDPSVSSAYNAWDANPCSPARANDVVREIGQLVDGLEPANLQYKVIVGGDDQLPFGRVPDETLIANESSYTTSLTGPNNQYKGAFGNSMLMTDDVYAEEGAPQLFGHELFVPDQAVGRLVETPGEITGMIDAFLAVDGALTPQRSLTTGYDFLTDGAREVNAPFNAAFGANARTLVNETWAARDPAGAPNNLPDDLEDALFPAAPTLPPQLNSINAHFDHSRLLPAAENLANRAVNLYTAQDVRDRGAAAVTGRVLFSMGCHSGLPVSDQIYTGGSAVAKDWSQTFLAGGAFAWIGNNGFGLGDTVDVAYTERLHALLTGNLDGSLTLGEALSQAKQDYLSTLAIVGGYDAKVVMQTTLFGLPMLEVGTGAPPVHPSPQPLHTDPGTGLQAASFNAQPSFTEVDTPHGTFYRAQTTQATNRRPIEPVVSFDVTQPDKVAHGIVITHLESMADEPNFDAAFSRVVTDKSEDEPELVGEASHPAKIQNLSTFSSFSSPAVTRQNAVLVAGLYRSDGVPDPLGIGIHRLYSEIGGYVLYAPPSETDFTPPELGPLDAQEIGSGVGFAVDVTDAGGAVEDVKVIYRDCAGNWHLSTLQSSGGDRWSGGGPPAGACDEIDYYLQAVDDAGNVAVSSKKVQIKPLDLPDPTGDTDIDFSLSGSLHASGWYTSAVGVTITGTPPSDLEYSLDGGAFQPYSATFSVAGTGVHFVEARAEDGSTNTAGFAIDTTDPVVLMTTPPAGAVYEVGQVVHADFTCADSGSGPASCTGTPANGARLDTNSLGTKTITVNATDKVGRSTTFQRTYEVVLRRILFASSRTGFGDIYAISPAGGVPARLTDSNAIDAEPEWFPGNERIVFSSSRTGNGDIYAMDDDGTNLNRLTSHGGIDTSPAVSPDGSRIAFSSNRESGNWDIYVMNANGSNVQRLTTDKNQDLLPAWSPDGTQIAFMSTRTAKGDIYKMNANGTSQTRLTSGSTANGIDSEPAWFGSTIAFSTNRHGDSNFEIYTMSSTGASQTRRTQQAGHDITPAWSGDGAKLVFATNRSPGGGLNFNIYTMNPDGSAQTALVTHGASDVFPDW